MDLVLRGEAQCQAGPGPLLSPSRRKFPEVVSKKELGSRDILWATAASHPAVLGVPSLRFQDQVLTGAPRWRPEFVDTGMTAQRK